MISRVLSPGISADVDTGNGNDIRPDTGIGIGPYTSADTGIGAETMGASVHVSADCGVSAGKVVDIYSKFDVIVSK